MSEILTCLKDGLVDASTVARVQSLLDVNKGPRTTAKVAKSAKEAMEQRRNASSNKNEILNPIDARTVAKNVLSISLQRLGTERNRSTASIVTGERSRKPLSTISNNIPQSPTRRPSKEHKNAAEVQQCDANTTSESILSCATIAIRYLHGNNAKDMDNRLINASLILSKHMIIQNMDALALETLSSIKCALDSSMCVKEQKQKKPLLAASKSRLSEMLPLKVSTTSDCELQRLSIQYYILVLRLMSGNIEEVHISRLVEWMTAKDTSPWHIINEQLKRNGDHDRANAQRQSLSKALLVLIAKMKEMMDMSTDKSSSIIAVAVFKLETQVLIFRMNDTSPSDNARSETCWQSARFLRSLHDLRQSLSTENAKQIHRAATDAYNLLFEQQDSTSRRPSFSLCDSMLQVAIAAEATKDIARWTAAMEDDCDNNNQNECQNLVRMLRKLTSRKDQLDTTLMNNITSKLSNKLSGQPEEYELVMDALHDLTSCLAVQQLNDTTKQLLKAAVSFTQWFIRYHPGRAHDYARKIISDVLTSKLASTELMTWLSKDAAVVFVTNDTLQSIEDAARTQPLKMAWTCSKDAAILAQILKLDVASCLAKSQQGIQKGTIVVEALEPQQEALVLQWQIGHTIKYASSNNKINSSLRSLVTPAFERLSKLYDSAEVTLESYIIATKAYLFAGLGILTESDLKLWCDVDRKQLDSARHNLKVFSPEILAAFGIAQYVHTPRRSSDVLQKALEALSQHLDTVQTDAKSPLYDAATLQCLLETVTALLKAMHSDALLQEVLVVRLKLEKLLKTESLELLMENAEYYAKYGLDNGMVSRLRHTIESRKVTTIQELQLLTALAEVLLAQSSLEECAQTLTKASDIHRSAASAKQSSHERQQMLLWTARAWKVRSQLCLHAGNTQESLFAGSAAVKLVNTAWHQIEKHRSAQTASDLDSEGSELDVQDSVGKTAIKFNLAGPNKNEQPTATGPAFWTLLPVACDVMMHLSDVYVHCGLFVDARFYSDRAFRMVEKLDGSSWKLRAQAHHASLLAMAKQLDEAELCLVDCESISMNDLPFIEYLQAQAFLCYKQQSTDEALKHLDCADRIMTDLKKELECTDVLATRSKQQQTCTARPQGTNKRSRRCKSDQEEEKKLESMKDVRSTTLQLICQRLVLLRLRITGLLPSDDQFFLNDIVAHQFVMKNNSIQLHQLLCNDLVLNAVPESVLSWSPCHAQFAKGSKPQQKDLKRKGQQRPKTVQHTTKSLDHSQDLSNATNALLGMLNQHSDIEMLSSASLSDIYIKTQLKTQAAFLLQALSATTHSYTANLSEMQPESTAAMAHHREQASVAAELRKTGMLVKSCPDGHDISCEENVSTDAKACFEILPESWTVVSLNLNEDRTRLNMVRHRYNQNPMAISIPFERHEDEADDDNLTFDACKKELLNIIQQANKSCHVGVDHTKKGAKTKWWQEREQLDRKLQSLLARIEHQWLGGFKGMLSLSTIPSEHISSFRSSLQATLEQHMPAKSCKQDMPFPELALELLLSLGLKTNSSTVEDDVVDILNYAIDALRFRGHGFATDEVDLDSLVVDVLALIQDSTVDCGLDDRNEHLILMLDKQMEMIPWENLPCLDKISTSRIKSFASLQEKLMMMMRAMNEENSSVCHVSLAAGTVILNPSSDLGQTQTTLEPMLEQLEKRKTWQTMIGRAPSEEEFQSVFSSSDVLLYFGHGAGTQYIRPRTIRKSKTASRVVWLMGCSSAAATEYGDFESSSVPAAYMLAGEHDSSHKVDHQDEKKSCLAVLANLWDVTDKDIDKFSIAVGDRWNLWSAPPPADEKQKKKPGRRLDRTATPITPKKSLSSSEVMSDCSLDTIQAGDALPMAAKSRPSSLSQAVADSRDVCYLRYLNGAAPVVYGIPVFLSR